MAKALEERFSYFTDPLSPQWCTSITHHSSKPISPLKENWMRPITNSPIIVFCVWHVNRLIHSVCCSTSLPSAHSHSTITLFSPMLHFRRFRILKLHCHLPCKLLSKTDYHQKANALKTNLTPFVCFSQAKCKSGWALSRPRVGW